MLVILTQNWSILTKFAKKNPAKSAVFYWLFLGEVFAKNFPWNRPIFLRICPENPSKFDFFPLKSREIGLFFCEFWLSFLPRNRPIFERILSFFPWKSREIGRFFRKFAPENPTKFCVFFPRNIRSPVQTCQDCSPAKTSGLSPQVPCFYYWATTKSYIFHKVQLKAPWISES